MSAANSEPQPTRAAENVAFLFAPGAGAPSSSAWMKDFRARLERVGPVECFDYAYQLAQRKTPDRLPALVVAHRAAFEGLRSRHSGPLVLIGKSMGGRVGCHLANELAGRGPSALVCLGYPLIGQNGALRDQVLLALETKILFVQGSRDSMCPLADLEAVRARMKAPSALHVVEGADHSLEVLKSVLKASGRTQAAVLDEVVERIAAFVRS